MWALMLPLRPAAALPLPVPFLLLGLLHVPVALAPALHLGLGPVRGTAFGGQRLRPGEPPEIQDRPAGQVRPSSRLAALVSWDSGRSKLAWHPWKPRPANPWWGRRGVVRQGQGGPQTRIPTHWAGAHSEVRGGSVLLETVATLTPGLRLQVPGSIEGLKRLQRQLLEQVREEPLRFVCAFSLLYLALQALTIPGSTILNVAAGCLFGFVPGLLLVTLLVTAGSLASYGLSSLLLCQVLEQWMPARLDRLRSQVASHQDRLLNYILFLRLSPVVPSWFINMASPVAGVPWRVFALASLVGFLPHTSVQVHAGCVLSTVSSLHDLYSIKVLVLLFLFSLLALLPTFLRASGDTNTLRAVSP